MVNLVYFIYHAMMVQVTPTVPLPPHIQLQPQLDSSAPGTSVAGTISYEGGKEESDHSIEDKVGQLCPLLSLFTADAWPVAQATLSVAPGSSSTTRVEGKPSSG